MKRVRHLLTLQNVFNKQFVAFGTSNNPEWTIPPIADADSTSFFTDIRTTPTSVAKYIKRLKLRKAAGLDGITNELLKILGPSICDPLSLIFNLSFSSGVFPSVWKRSVVVPIYKNKGSKSDPTNNYRPISLLSAISKLCERVMYDRLYAHVNPLLSPAQSGFRKGDSTVWQLLARFTQNLLERRHQHNFSLVCFFDLSKAFDTVWHRGLLAKVASFNIGGNVLRWLENYLSCRVQQIRVSGSLSQPLEVCSGVPQGSILGPLVVAVAVEILFCIADQTGSGAQYYDGDKVTAERQGYNKQASTKERKTQKTQTANTQKEKEKGKKRKRKKKKAQLSHDSKSKPRCWLTIKINL